MKLISLLVSFIFSVALCSQESANFGNPKFEPPSYKKLLIMGQDLGAVGGLDAYEEGYVDNVTCHTPAGVTSYTALPELDGLTASANWGSGDVNASAYLEDETFDNSFIVIGLWMVDRLANVIDGSYDQSIKNLAAWVGGQQRPVFLRLGYEFEGPWNNYDPQEFKEAWRHIVHVFDQQNIRNAAFVWQSAGLNYNNIEDWYPGDEYVNWLGYSHFNVPNAGQSIRDFAEEHDKPIMIAEATPQVDLKIVDGNSIWNSWYSGLFNSIYNNPRVKALAYINVDWDSQPLWQGQGWGDSRVQVNEVVKLNWELETCGDPWLSSNDTLLQELAFDFWTPVSDFHQDEIDLRLVFENEQLYIKGVTGQELFEIEFYDFSGRLIFKNRNLQSQHVINVKQLIEGPYLIKAFHKQEISTIKYLLAR